MGVPNSSKGEARPAEASSPGNRTFILLFAATFLAYANNSVFFQFYEHLNDLPIDPKWFGLLIGAFSAASLVVRPLVSPFFHMGNARRFLFIGTTAVIVALFSYSLADGFWCMLLVRTGHALAYVVLGAALMTITVAYIPKEKSGQVFGLLAVVILIPNTIVPPVLPFLDRTLGGFNRVLMLFGLLTVLVFPLVAGAGRIGVGAETSAGRTLTGREILDDLRDPRLIAALSAMLLLYSSHALVFFFLDGYGRSIGIAGTGFFLTLATCGEIGVRVAVGSLFDKMDKGRLAAWTMIGLAILYGLLGHVPGRFSFFALGAAMGLGWGVAMPVFNGLMFDMSTPKYRAFNINLGLQMFQGGFFLGPFIGGPVVMHWGFPHLFHVCGAFGLISAAFCFYLSGRIKAAA